MQTADLGPADALKRAAYASAGEREHLLLGDPATVHTQSWRRAASNLG